MTKTRNQYPASFKVKVAVAALREDASIPVLESQVPSPCDCHPSVEVGGAGVDGGRVCGEAGGSAGGPPCRDEGASQTVLTLDLNLSVILSVLRLPAKPGYVQVEMYCEKVRPTFA